LKNGGYDKIPDDKHLISAAQGFPAEVKQDTGHPVDFSYITRGYEIFDNWPSSKPAPSLIKERATLKRLAADRDLLLSLVADIQYITSNPFQFGNPDIDALKLKRQNAERLLQAVQLTGEAFAENPFLNHDLPTLDLSNILPLPQRRHDYTLPLAIRVHPNALQPLDFPANEWAGTTKQFRPLERFSVKFEPAVPGLSITYDVSGQFFQEFGGWRSFALGGHDGILTPDDPHDPFRRSYMLGTIRFRLTGELAKHYDVSYQTHNKNVGDSAVAKNGQVIGYGPTGSDMIWVEAIKVWVTAKN
jgi:hypothetical protein